MGNTTSQPSSETLKENTLSKSFDIPLRRNEIRNDDRIKTFEKRRLVRYIQMLVEELREVPEDNEFEIDMLKQEIEKVVKILESHFNVPRSTLVLEEDIFEDARENQQKSNQNNKRIKFGKPRIAFYESQGQFYPSPKQNHASHEELIKHDEEMEQAYAEALENPQWYGGTSKLI